MTEKNLGTPFMGDFRMSGKATFTWSELHPDGPIDPGVRSLASAGVALCVGCCSSGRQVSIFYMSKRPIAAVTAITSLRELRNGEISRFNSSHYAVKSGLGRVTGPHNPTVPLENLEISERMGIIFLS
jgi:hypothetical protein